MPSWILNPSLYSVQPFAFLLEKTIEFRSTINILRYQWYICKNNSAVIVLSIIELSWVYFIQTIKDNSKKIIIKKSLHQGIRNKECSQKGLYYIFTYFFIIIIIFLRKSKQYHNNIFILFNAQTMSYLQVTFTSQQIKNIIIASLSSAILRPYPIYIFIIKTLSLLQILKQQFYWPKLPVRLFTFFYNEWYNCFVWCHCLVHSIRSHHMKHWGLSIRTLDFNAKTWDLHVTCFATKCASVKKMPSELKGVMHACNVSLKPKELKEA